MFQDVTYKPFGSKLTANTRFAWFNTTNYSSRIYAYESDVLYAFYMPAYYGKGMRCYLNVGYQPLEKIKLWLRLARTTYFNEQEILSGLDKIEANHKTEVKLQVLLSL